MTQKQNNEIEAHNHKFINGSLSGSQHKRQEGNGVDNSTTGASMVDPNVCNEPFDSLERQAIFNQGSLSKQKEMLDDEIKFLKNIKLGILSISSENTHNNLDRKINQRLDELKKKLEGLK